MVDHQTKCLSDQESKQDGRPTNNRVKGGRHSVTAQTIKESESLTTAGPTSQPRYPVMGGEIIHSILGKT